MANKSEHIKRAIVEAMEQSLGVVTTACRKVGIGRTTYYEYYNTDLKFKEEIDDLQNVALDFAESQLHKQIKEGNSTATIFFLKTKGKKRGYIERQEVDVSSGKLFQIEVLGEDLHE
jgi:undecaprenyl pyrophosphate synthase